MNDPKRYNFSATIVHQIGGEKTAALKYHADPEGLFVSYEDYARLKAEVERLTFDPLTYLDDQGEWMPRHIHLAAVERLKAEVERLTKHDDDTCRHYIMRLLLESQNTFLNARVERLTKAGDLLAFHYISLGRKFFPNDPLPSSIKDWNAAKEGKGQP